GWIIRPSATRLAAPFVSSCSRSAPLSASAFAASRSQWLPAALPPWRGLPPPCASTQPLTPGPRPPDTRCRDASGAAQPQGPQRSIFTHSINVNLLALLAPRSTSPAGNVTTIVLQSRVICHYSMRNPG